MLSVQRLHMELTVGVYATDSLNAARPQRKKCSTLRDPVSSHTAPAALAVDQAGKARRTTRSTQESGPVATRILSMRPAPTERHHAASHRTRSHCHPRTLNPTVGTNTTLKSIHGAGLRHELIKMGHVHAQASIAQLQIRAPSLRALLRYPPTEESDQQTGGQPQHGHYGAPAEHALDRP